MDYSKNNSNRDQNDLARVGLHHPATITGLSLSVVLLFALQNAQIGNLFSQIALSAVAFAVVWLAWHRFSNAQ